MKPKSGGQKANSRVSFIETKWKSVLDLFDVSKLRRGKAMEKQGQVSDVSIPDGTLHAKIEGPKMRFAKPDVYVTLPLVQGGKAYQSKVAQLLYSRPDWQGMLLGGDWSRDFWDAVTNMGLEWYPGESSAKDWLQGVTCTCNDPEMPCFHVAAVLFAVLHEMEENPLFALRFLGIEENDLLDEVHKLGAGESRTEMEFNLFHQRKSANPEKVASDKEEEAVYQKTSEHSGEQIRHRLPPNWDSKKRATWREHYMAWK